MISARVYIGTTRAARAADLSPRVRIRPWKVNIRPVLAARREIRRSFAMHPTGGLCTGERLKTYQGDPPGGGAPFEIDAATGRMRC